MTNQRGNSGRRNRNGATNERDDTEMTNATANKADVIVDNNTRTSLVVGVPVGLHVAITKAAKDAGFDSATLFAARQLAEAVGYDGPIGGKSSPRSSKSDEEKKAEMQARAKAKREAVKAALARYEGN